MKYFGFYTVNGVVTNKGSLLAVRESGVCRLLLLWSQITLLTYHPSKATGAPHINEPVLAVQRCLTACEIQIHLMNEFLVNLKICSNLILGKHTALEASCCLHM